MKTTILSIVIAVAFASCVQDKAVEQVATSITKDTSGFAQYMAWKEQQAALSKDNMNQNFDTEAVDEETLMQPAVPVPVVVYQEAPAKRSVVRAPQQKSVKQAPIRTRSGSGSKGGSRESSSRNETGTAAGSGTSNGDIAVSQPEQIPAKKEGWSKAAKGTAIGGASGAVLGAVISKNKTKGAVIGGVVGAAGGYIYGRSQDKKDGRY